MVSRSSERLACVFEVLKHPVRIELLKLLTKKRNVTQLTFELNVNQSLISQHLRVLYLTRLVERERVGTRIYYKLTDLGRKIVKLFKEFEGGQGVRSSS